MINRSTQFSTEEAGGADFWYVIPGAILDNLVNNVEIPTFLSHCLFSFDRATLTVLELSRKIKFYTEILSNILFSNCNFLGFSVQNSAFLSRLFAKLCSFIWFLIYQI